MSISKKLISCIISTLLLCFFMGKVNTVYAASQNELAENSQVSSSQEASIEQQAELPPSVDESLPATTPQEGEQIIEVPVITPEIEEPVAETPEIEEPIAEMPEIEEVVPEAPIPDATPGEILVEETIETIPVVEEPTNDIADVPPLPVLAETPEITPIISTATNVIQSDSITAEQVVIENEEISLQSIYSDANILEVVSENFNTTLQQIEEEVDDDDEVNPNWLEKDGKLYYINPETKKRLTGFHLIDDEIYYFNPETKGAAIRGFFDVPEVGRIYFGSKYHAIKGWIKNKSGTYYGNMKTSVITTGLKKIKGEFYYFNPEKKGLMQKGFVDVGKARYYFRSDGQAVKGWIKRGKKRYLSNKKTAKIRTGYAKFEGYHYWLDPSKQGLVLKGVVTIPKYGKVFVSSKYKNLSGWIKSGKKKYYANKKTYKLLTGTRKIDGALYQFDKTGLLKKSLGKSKSATNGNHGIDVSAHQGLINWAAVKASKKVDFAIIRALTWDKATKYYAIDPFFDANVRGAKAHGIKVGVYIFSYAFNNNEMAEEVNYFTNHPVVKQHKKEKIIYDLPVFIDFEYAPALQHNTTIAGRTDMIRSGMVLLDKNGYTPGFYSSTSWAKNHFNATALQNEGYDFWMARYYTNNADKQPNEHGWDGPPLALWQYSSRASIPGISGNVDVNYSYKNYKFTPIGSKKSGSESASLTTNLAPLAVFANSNASFSQKLSNTFANVPTVVYNETSPVVENQKIHAVSATNFVSSDFEQNNATLENHWKYSIVSILLFDNKLEKLDNKTTSLSSFDENQPTYVSLVNLSLFRMIQTFFNLQTK